MQSGRLYLKLRRQMFSSTYMYSCLPLFHEHQKREELLDVLIDAGESAWARGAHEVCISAIFFTG